MLKYFFLCILVLSQILSCNVASTQPTKVVIKLNVHEFKDRTNHYDRGFLIPLNDTLGLAQFGIVDILLVNFQNGNISKSIATKDLELILNENIKPIIGEDFYLPDVDQYLKYSTYAGSTPYFFHNLIYWPERKKYLTIVTAVFFNQSNIYNQQLLHFVLMFNQDLNGLKLIHLKQSGLSSGSGWLSGGFLLAPDKLFTKAHGFQHGNNFDFFQYNLTRDYQFEYIDPIENLTVSETGYPTRFFSTFAFVDNQYLNLGNRLYKFESSEFLNGEFVPLPIDSSMSLVAIDAINFNNSLGFYINDYSNEPSAIGRLVLFSDDFQSYELIKEYDIAKTRFCSLKTLAGKAYVLFFDKEKKEFFIKIYDDFK